MYLSPAPVSASPVGLLDRPQTHLRLPIAPQRIVPMSTPRPLARGAGESAMALLRDLPLFRSLDESQLDHLASRAVVRHFRRGERVVEQGRQQDTLFVLLSGKAHAMRTGTNGRSLLLQVLKAGDFFGELGVIDGQAHNGSVRCLVQCDVLMLPGRDVDQCLMQWPEFAQALVQIMVRRLRATNRRIASLALHDVHDRVIDFLRDNGEVVADGVYHVRGRVSRTEMAFMVGASREMVCRVMRQLSRRGIIDARTDGSIVVRPPADAALIGTESPED
jgi:CRP-like cAMP-binding protein